MVTIGQFGNHLVIAAVPTLDYNFARIQQNARMKPANAAGVFDRIRSLEEIVFLAQ
jgi:hypothetical protein